MLSSFGRRGALHLLVVGLYSVLLLPVSDLFGFEDVRDIYVALVSYVDDVAKVFLSQLIDEAGLLRLDDAPIDVDDAQTLFVVVDVPRLAADPHERLG